ncbi:hypothetical protein GCM10009767_20470 [Kocuria aegyptia]|uniref:Uncharacterized protein n=1 Tax=Kocuria aegyptia TaxID=330943 RepID=A0ABP4WRW8_9MICC
MARSTDCNCPGAAPSGAWVPGVAPEPGAGSDFSMSIVVILSIGWGADDDAVERRSSAGEGVQGGRHAQLLTVPV